MLIPVAVPRALALSITSHNHSPARRGSVEVCVYKDNAWPIVLISPTRLLIALYS